MVGQLLLLCWRKLHKLTWRVVTFVEGRQEEQVCEDWRVLKDPVFPLCG